MTYSFSRFGLLCSFIISLLFSLSDIAKLEAMPAVPMLGIALTCQVSPVVVLEELSLGLRSLREK